MAVTKCMIRSKLKEDCFGMWFAGCILFVMENIPQAAPEWGNMCLGPITVSNLQGIRRTEKEMVVFKWFAPFPFHSSWDSQAMGCCHLHSGFVFSSQLHLLGSILTGRYRQCTWLILQVFLNPIKLTLKINHLWYFWYYSRKAQSVSVTHSLFVFFSVLSMGRNKAGPVS